MLALVVAAVLANNNPTATSMMPGFVEGLSSIAPSPTNTRTTAAATTPTQMTGQNSNININNTTNNMRLLLRDSFMEAQLLTGLSHVALETAGFAHALANNNNNNSGLTGSQHIIGHQQYHHYRHDSMNINRVTLEQQRLKLFAIVGRILDWPSINTGEVWIQVLLMCVAMKEFVFNNNNHINNDGKWF